MPPMVTGEASVIVGSMGTMYDGSDEQMRLRAVETYLRYLLRKSRNTDEVPLPISLPMIQHIEEVESLLRQVKNGARTAAFSEMVTQDVEEISTPEWEAQLVTSPSVTKVDSQKVAEAVLEQIQEQEVRRNRGRVAESAVRSITATTFWSTIEALTVKWSKTRLKKRNILLEDYGVAGAPQNTVEVSAKSNR